MTWSHMLITDLQQFTRQVNNHSGTRVRKRGVQGRQKEISLWSRNIGWFLHEVLPQTLNVLRWIINTLVQWLWGWWWGVGRGRWEGKTQSSPCGSMKWVLFWQGISPLCVKWKTILLKVPFHFMETPLAQRKQIRHFSFRDKKKKKLFPQF